MSRARKWQILGSVGVWRRRSHPWSRSAINIVTGGVSVSWETVPWEFIDGSFTIPDVVMHCVDDVGVGRKTLWIVFTIEETHGVPFAPNSTQSGRRESKRVAGHRVERHLPCIWYKVVNHIPKAVSSAIWFTGGVVEIIRPFGASGNGVEKAPASFHFRSDVVPHCAQTIRPRTLIQTEVRYTRWRWSGRDGVVVARGCHCPISFSEVEDGKNRVVFKLLKYKLRPRVSTGTVYERLADWRLVVKESWPIGK